MNLKISLILLFLVALIVFLMVQFKMEGFQSYNSDSNCPFIAHGNTRQECIDACYVKRRFGEKGCNTNECYKKCNSCISIDCKWNKTNKKDKKKSPPEKPKIKVFTGDASAKITWIKPYSHAKIDRYVLVVETDGESPRINFPPVIENSFCEYTIFGLENDKRYRVHMYAENIFGSSEASNNKTIVPRENKQIPVFSSKKNYEFGLDDSLEKVEKGIQYEVKDNLLKSIGYKKDAKDYNDILVLLFDELKRQKNRKPLSEMNIKIN